MGEISLQLERQKKDHSDPSKGCAFSAFSFSSLCWLPSLSGLKEENLILGVATAAINFADIVRAAGAMCGVRGQGPVAGVLGATQSVMLDSLHLDHARLSPPRSC